VSVRIFRNFSQICLQNLFSCYDMPRRSPKKRVWKSRIVKVDASNIIERLWKGRTPSKFFALSSWPVSKVIICNKFMSLQMVSAFGNLHYLPFLCFVRTIKRKKTMPRMTSQFFKMMKTMHKMILTNFRSMETMLRMGIKKMKIWLKVSCFTFLDHSFGTNKLRKSYFQNLQLCHKFFKIAKTNRCWRP